MRIKLVTPDVKSAWDEFVLHRPTTCYQRYDWLTVLADTYGCEPLHLGAWEDTALVGTLPLFGVKKFGLGSYVSSMPGGVIADEVSVAKALVDEGIKLTQARKASYFKLRDSQCQLKDDRLQNQIEHNFSVTLADSEDEMWKQIKKTCRRMVKKAQEHQLSMVSGRQHLQEFYRIYALAMRRFGSPVPPLKFFESILKLFPEQTDILAVQREERPIMAAIVFHHQDIIYDLYGASLFEEREAYPNDFYYWELMRYGLQRNCTSLDFGRSLIDSGVAKFKQKWGAVAQPLHYQYALKNTSKLPNVRTDRRHQWVMPIWKKLPLPIVNRLSAWVRAYMPFA